AVRNCLAQPAAQPAAPPQSSPSIFRRMWNWLRSGLSRPSPPPLPPDDRPTPDTSLPAPDDSVVRDGNRIHRPTTSLPRPVEQESDYELSLNPEIVDSAATLN